MRSDRIGFEDARKLIGLAVSPTNAVDIPLEHALRRAVAGTVKAAANHLPFRCSAMDGFAIHSSNLLGGNLRLVPAVYAGTLPNPLSSGEAAPIATGAPIPLGALQSLRVRSQGPSTAVHSALSMRSMPVVIFASVARM